MKVKNEAKELQNLAFGGSKKKNKKKNPANKDKIKATGDLTSQPKGKEESQFEEWKERDKVLENDNFKAALQEAILRSQLEYEEHQQTVKAQETAIGLDGEFEEVLSSPTKDERKKSNKQSKKSATMSMDQFNRKSEVQILHMILRLP